MATCTGTHLQCTGAWRKAGAGRTSFDHHLTPGTRALHAAQGGTAAKARAHQLEPPSPSPSEVGRPKHGEGGRKPWGQEQASSVSNSGTRAWAHVLQRLCGRDMPCIRVCQATRVQAPHPWPLPVRAALGPWSMHWGMQLLCTRTQRAPALLPLQPPPTPGSCIQTLLHCAHPTSTVCVSSLGGLRAWQQQVARMLGAPRSKEGQRHAVHRAQGAGVRR